MSVFGIKTEGGDVVRLPILSQLPPHKFEGDAFVAEDPSTGRHDQRERTCAYCGLVKITVFGPNNVSWREWRLKDSEAQFEGPTPACVEVPSP